MAPETQLTNKVPSPITLDWLLKLEAVLSSEGRSEIVEVDPIEVRTLRGFGHVFKAWSVGDVVVIALAEKAEDDPVVVLTEIRFRSALNTTFSKEYGALKTKGAPNFKRIVRTALDTAIRFSPKVDYNRRTLPKGMLVQTDTVGYQVHIPSRNVTEWQLEKMIEILSTDEQSQQQPASNPTPIEDTPEVLSGSGECVEECQSVEQNLGQELPANSEVNDGADEPPPVEN